MAVTSLWRVKGDIGSVIRYAENPDKTLLKGQDGLCKVRPRALQQQSSRYG